MSDSATKNTGAEHCGEGMNEEYLEDIVQKQIDKSVNQINDYNHFEYP